MSKIKTALISTFYKEGLEVLITELAHQKVEIISTGGTLAFIRSLGVEARSVEDLTQFPEMLGGRVKTLHPKVFGGILYRRDEPTDEIQIEESQIPGIDLVVVNLYPFEETLQKGGSREEIIEKIDIGGVSLIRAAAKNHDHVCIVADQADYKAIAEELHSHDGHISFETKQKMAAKAFSITAAYDSAISSWLYSEFHNGTLPASLTISAHPQRPLRYGENPHQAASFYGDLNKCFDQLHGKELSYNNLVDIDSALKLLADLGKKQPSAVIIKHTNACGAARAHSLELAYEKALACDPVSAFGGIIALNGEVDEALAAKLNQLFFEVLLAPIYTHTALELLKQKKNRIILQTKVFSSPALEVKTILNGYLAQTPNIGENDIIGANVVTEKSPTPEEWEAMEFAQILVKHTKSNAIVLAKKDQLLASGTGQTSRVDALLQAIHKAHHFGFELKGAAMASDAFFPFSDCVEIAAEAGISCVIQPGGSIKDADSIEACNKKELSMVLTGTRHFKH